MNSIKTFSVNKNVLVISVALIIYYFIMEQYYQYFIVVEYRAFNFQLNENLSKSIEVKIFFVLFLIQSLFVSRSSPFIYSVFIFFFIFFLVPALILYAWADQPAGPLYSIVLLQLAMGSISLLRIRIPIVKSVSLTDEAILFFVFLTLIPIFLKYGVYLNPTNFLFQDIYQTRAQFNENSAAGINYLYNWEIKAIIPIILTFFLIHKRYGYALISLLTLIYLYVISGNKIVYLTSFIVLFFCLVGDDYFEKTKYFSLALVLGLLLMPLIDCYLLKSHSLKGIFVMRMLFFPAHLNYDYFEFFRDSPLYFAESNFFRWFATYPYDRPVGFIIAQTFYNTVDMNANNGIISDGYMNLGYWGIVINILIVSIIFMFFNSLNLNSGYLGIFFLMIFLFLSAPMLSMIVTSGLWIIIVMALTIMRKDRPSVA